MTQLNVDKILSEDTDSKDRSYENIYFVDKADFMSNRARTKNSDIRIVVIIDFDEKMDVDKDGIALFDDSKERIGVVLRHDEGKESLLLLPEMKSELNPDYKGFYGNIRKTYEAGLIGFCAKLKSGEIVPLPVS